ncbi:MAG: glycosyltransferase family 4 protein [Patescibacteria group bacterium]
MRIAQVTSTFPPYEGGSGNVCYNLSKKLSILGHDVTVFLPETEKRLSHKLNMPFKIKYLKPYYSIGNASVLPSLKKILIGFDIIHLHYPFFGGDIIVKQAAKKRNIPYVITYHQDAEGDSLLKKTIFQVYNLFFQKSVMDGAKMVLGLSDDHINHSQVSYLKKKEGKVAIIPNGINLEDFTQILERPDVRKEYKIEEKKFIIAFIGTLDKAHYFKRLDILFEAFKSFTNKAHLLVIGDGDLKEKYIKLAKELGISQQISFVGKLSNKEALQHLIQADLLVLPSTKVESFGLVLIEAMACAKPVIASNLPGVRTVVNDGVNGLLFEKGNVKDLTDKIGILLKDSVYARRLGQNGRRKVEDQYTWDSIAKKVECMYKTALIR